MFGFLVRPIGITGPTIRPSWPGHGADFDSGESEACEEKSASLPLPETGLPMVVEVGEYTFTEG